MTMQIQEEHKEHPVLSVCIEDFITQAEGDEESNGLLAFAETMTKAEWRYLAELMADDLYDGDRFTYAMIRAVLKIKATREQ
jgi:hypothetical protein